jgi:hypothetical protein
VRGPRILAAVVALVAATAITPAADAHWQNCATAYGYQYGLAYDEFSLCAGHDGQAAIVELSVSKYTAFNRPLGTYVVADLFGSFVSDWDYAPMDRYVRSAAYGNLVAAQFRFRSGHEFLCTRWNFDPWNGYRQDWGPYKCPEEFAGTPPALKPVTDLILR